MFRRLILTAVCIASIVVDAAAQAKKPQHTDVSALIQMEHRWADAVLKNDADTIASMLSEGFVQTGSNGKIKSAQQVLDATRSGDRKLTRSELFQIEVKLFQKETVAVVTGVWSGEGTYKGEPMKATERWTDTWIKTKDGWKCISSQSTDTGGQ